MLVVESVEDRDNQLWYMTQIENADEFRLHTVQKGDFWAVDVLNYYGHDSIDLQFQSNGEKTGQYWAFAKCEDGSFKISNNYTGPYMYLEVLEDLQATLAGGDNAGQHWTLSLQGSGSISISPSSLATSTITAIAPGSRKPEGSSQDTPSAPSACKSSEASCTATSFAKGGVSTAAIAGASVGGILGLGSIIGAIIYGMRWWRKGHRASEPYEARRNMTSDLHL